jgi:hypothetical protein
MQPAPGGRENRNDFARLVDKTQDMKKQLFIGLIFLALLILAALGTIISKGGN